MNGNTTSPPPSLQIQQLEAQSEPTSSGTSCETAVPLLPTQHTSTDSAKPPCPVLCFKNLTRSARKIIAIGCVVGLLIYITYHAVKISNNVAENEPHKSGPTDPAQNQTTRPH